MDVPRVVETLISSNKFLETYSHCLLYTLPLYIRFFPITMKNATTTLQFQTLPDLARFLKKINPKSYLANTLQLRLTAQLSELEIAIAVEQYSAELPLMAMTA